MRKVRVIIAIYREDCPRSERPRISSVHQGRTELLEARYQVLICFYSVNTLCSELMYRHHVNTDFISTQVKGNDKLHILYTFYKISGNWMSAPSWFLCLKTAITFTCTELLISVHNDRHLFANGFVTIKLLTMIFIRLRKRVKIKVGNISPESIKFNPMKLTMIFKLNL